MNTSATALSLPRSATTTPATAVGGGWIGTTLLALAVAAVLGPFAWILTASFKYQIAIYSGEWPFTPTLSNYAEVLFGYGVGMFLFSRAVQSVDLLAQHRAF